MINAVLVFNNNGQPRLTKFYTQIVSDRDGTPARKVFDLSADISFCRTHKHSSG